MRDDSGYHTVEGFSAAIDAEGTNKYTVKVRAHDTGGDSIASDNPLTVTVHVTDVNEAAPVIASFDPASGVSVPEDTTPTDSAIITTMTIADDDGVARHVREPRHGRERGA